MKTSKKNGISDFFSDIKDPFLRYSNKHKWPGVIILPFVSALHVFLTILMLIYAVVFVKWPLFVAVMGLGLYIYFKFSKKVRHFYLVIMKWSPWPFYIFEYGICLLLYSVWYVMFFRYIINTDPNFIYEQLGACLLYATRLFLNFFFIPVILRVVIFALKRLNGFIKKKKSRKPARKELQKRRAGTRAKDDYEEEYEEEYEDVNKSESNMCLTNN